MKQNKPLLNSYERALIAVINDTFASTLTKHRDLMKDTQKITADFHKGITLAQYSKLEYPL